MRIRDALPEAAPLHHAYLIEGDAQTAEELLALLRDRGVVHENTPDLFIRTYVQLGIGDARELRERASRKPLEGRNIFIVTCDSLTGEAQNALLKTLEDPQSTNTFFLIVRASDTLLPTLRSRAYILTPERAIGTSVISPDTFLRATPAERLEQLTILTEERNVPAAMTFLATLERELAPHAAASAGVRDGLTALYAARTYLGDTGALTKPLLESVALLVPVFPLASTSRA